MKQLSKLLFTSLTSLLFSVYANTQVTKTLNGTVRYESGMSETKFSTPNGNVVMKLPQSLTGITITGTVSAEPAGKTEKEKNRNLEQLLKFTVNLDGQKIPVSGMPANFDWLTHPGRVSRTPMELLNSSGTKLAEVSLPPVLSSPATFSSGNAPRLTTPSNVLVKGDALNVYTNQQFSPGEKFILTDSKGQQFTMNPIARSSHQAVMNVPEAAAPGNCSVSRQVDNQLAPGSGVNSPVIDDDHGKASFNLIDINLNSPNTNLRSGQTSSVTLSIDTRDPAEIDSNEFLVFRVDMKNLTPGVVDMAGGNMQAISFPLSDNRQDPSAWQLSRTITGVKPGGFSVSATLHEDYTTSNDPFRPQLNVLKTPEDFNAWATALKKDLEAYAGIQSNDGPGQVIKTNTQRAVDNIPVCSDPGQLDECKAVIYSLIHPLDVQKGAANTWLSSYETFKTAISRFAEIEPTLIEFPSYINGLDFMERLSYRSNDPSMTQDITNTRQLVNTINETGETKENLNQLRQALGSLSSRTDKKLKTDPVRNNIWKLSDLLFSTYCFNKRTKDGIDPMKSMIAYLDPVKKILQVKPEYQQQVLSTLNASPLGNGSYKINAVTASLSIVTYDIQVAPLLMADIYQNDWWAERLIEMRKKDTSAAEVITTHMDSTTGTWYIFFKDAECVNVLKESNSNCLEDIDFVMKEDGSFERKKKGGYYKLHYQELNRCKKGKNFCIEVFQVWKIITYYHDKDCKAIRKTEEKSEFGCLK